MGRGAFVKRLDFLLRKGWNFVGDEHFTTTRHLIPDKMLSKNLFPEPLQDLFDESYTLGLLLRMILLLGTFCGATHHEFDDERQQQTQTCTDGDAFV